MAEPIEMPFGV